MARNSGKGSRVGSVTNRSQIKTHKVYVKRDTTTGRFTDVKSDGKPFKGVAREPDGRRG
ncbi:MAG TPA: hypothetical protein PLW14_06305 [Chlorobiota bacterium]|nr:hypothetical protein [Chlorobiota bacterium]